MLRTRRAGRSVVVAVAGAAMLALAGCGGGSSTTSPADTAFLGDVHQTAPDIGEYRSDVQLVRLGDAACDGFRSGASFEELADRLSLLEGSNTIPPGDLGTVLSASLEYLCPQYQSSGDG